MAAVLAAAVTASVVLAQRTGPLPQELRDVGIEDRLGAAIPLEVELIDEDGGAVRLGRHFSPGRPVLLNLGYYECPMLCGLVLNGLITGLEGLSWLPGREFEIVTLSINPLETPALARPARAGSPVATGRRC